MARRFDTGDGDSCPQNPEHGRMFFLRPDRQFCAHSDHRALALYLRDGVTAVARPASAIPVPEADQAIDSQPPTGLWASMA